MSDDPLERVSSACRSVYAHWSDGGQVAYVNHSELLDTETLWISKEAAEQAAIFSHERELVNEAAVMDYLYRFAPCLQPNSEN